MSTERVSMWRISRGWRNAKLRTCSGPEDLSFAVLGAFPPAACSARSLTRADTCQFHASGHHGAASVVRRLLLTFSPSAASDALYLPSIHPIRPIPWCIISFTSFPCVFRKTGVCVRVRYACVYALRLNRAVARWVRVGGWVAYRTLHRDSDFPNWCLAKHSRDRDDVARRFINRTSRLIAAP